MTVQLSRDCKTNVFTAGRGCLPFPARCCVTRKESLMSSCVCFSFKLQLFFLSTACLKNKFPGSHSNGEPLAFCLEAPLRKGRRNRGREPALHSLHLHRSPWSKHCSWSQGAAGLLPPSAAMCESAPLLALTPTSGLQGLAWLEAGRRSLHQ